MSQTKFSINPEDPKVSTGDAPRPVVDLHDLIVLLSRERAQRSAYLIDYKLSAVTRISIGKPLPQFNAESFAKIQRVWDSSDQSRRLAILFDEQREEDWDEDESNDEDEDGNYRHRSQHTSPQFFTPTTMLYNPIPPTFAAYTPKDLEAVYWRAVNCDGHNSAVELMECLFETWPEPKPLIRIRIPPSKGRPKVEYVTCPYKARKAIEFTTTNARELVVLRTPSLMTMNCTRGKDLYGVIGFSRMDNLPNGSPGPVDTILDLSSMIYGKVGQAYNHPFALVRKEEYVGEYLPKYAESNTFSQATYNRMAQKLLVRRDGAAVTFGKNVEPIAEQARHYYDLKQRSQSAYCAYCGMPEKAVDIGFSVGTPMMRCSTCKDEYYCNAEHQKFAWSYHKHFCQPV